MNPHLHRVDAKTPPPVEPPRRPAGTRVRGLSTWTAGWLVACLAVCSMADVASAQTEDSAARRVFKIAVAHYENGEFLDAAQRFAQAYQLTETAPKPGHLFYNIYLAYRDANEPTLARNSLAAYLESATEVENRELLDARLADLVEKFGPVEPFDVAAAAEGRLPDRAAPLRRDTSGEPSDTATSGQDDATFDQPIESTPTEGAASPKPGPLFVPGLVVGGVGAAAMVGAIVTGALAMSNDAKLDALCGTNRQCSPDQAAQATSLSRRIKTFSTATDVLLFGGAALAAAGATMALIALPRGRKDKATADAPSGAFVCGPQGCFATVKGRF